MEGIVAKRCLRQSSIGKEMYGSRVNKKNILNEIYRKNDTISKSLNKEESNTRNLFEKFVFSPYNFQRPLNNTNYHKNNNQK